MSPMPLALPPQKAQIQLATISNQSVDILPQSTESQHMITLIGGFEGVAVMVWANPQSFPFSNSNQKLAKTLCKEHPSISIDQQIFGGIPHLRGLRLSVADILSQIYVTGSIKAVEEMYSPDVSEDQIKEAVAYAQDFIESALSSRS